MNTPNKLTIARMILVPFFVLFILTGWGGDANRYICLAIFVVASITDWFEMIKKSTQKIGHTGFRSRIEGFI